MCQNSGDTYRRALSFRYLCTSLLFKALFDISVLKRLYLTQGFFQISEACSQFFDAFSHL